MHSPIPFVSAALIIGFVILILMFQEGSVAFFTWLRSWLTSTFNWVLMNVGNIFVLFCLFPTLSPLGNIRLGGADARPDYS